MLFISRKDLSFSMVVLLIKNIYIENNQEVTNIKGLILGQIQAPMFASLPLAKL